MKISVSIYKNHIMQKALLVIVCLIFSIASFSQRNRLQRSGVAPEKPKQEVVEEENEFEEKQPEKQEEGQKVDTCNCDTDLELDRERDVVYFKKEKGSPPFTGACKAFFPNTNITRIEASFAGGKSDGKTIKYYKSGRKNAQTSHSNGIKDGEWKFWDDNEDTVLRWSNVYSMGELDGKQVWYYPNGKVKKIEYYDNGVKDGVKEEYFEDGTLKKEIGYKDKKMTSMLKKQKKKVIYQDLLLNLLKLKRSLK